MKCTYCVVHSKVALYQKRCALEFFISLYYLLYIAYDFVLLVKI